MPLRTESSPLVGLKRSKRRQQIPVTQSSYDLSMEFEWDESKAAANLKKHGISFEEAKTVFDNVLAVIFDDESHSEGERREIIVGHSRNNRLLLVSFTERPSAIRIISVRLATRREREDYERNAF